jgi:hypothetical protein
MSHTFEVYEVQEQDGTLPPTLAQRDIAASRRSAVEASSERGKNPRAHDKGFIHPIGDPRYVTRYAWRSSTGRSSNGCTFPTFAAAETAAKQHVDSYRDRAAA